MATNFVFINEDQVRDRMRSVTQAYGEGITAWFQKVFYRHLVRTASARAVPMSLKESLLIPAVNRISEYRKGYFDDRPVLHAALLEVADNLCYVQPAVFNVDGGIKWRSLTPTHVEAITNLGMCPVTLGAFAGDIAGVQAERVRYFITLLCKAMQGKPGNLLAYGVTSMLDHAASFLREEHVEHVTRMGHDTETSPVVYKYGDYELVHLQTVQALGACGMQLRNCLRTHGQDYLNKGKVLATRKPGTREYTSVFTLVGVEVASTRPKFINEIDSDFEAFAGRTPSSEEQEVLAQYLYQEEYHSSVTGEHGVAMDVVIDACDQADRDRARERMRKLLEEYKAENTDREYNRVLRQASTLRGQITLGFNRPAPDLHRTWLELDWKEIHDRWLDSVRSSILYGSVLPLAQHPRELASLGERAQARTASPTGRLTARLKPTIVGPWPSQEAPRPDQGQIVGYHVYTGSGANLRLHPHQEAVLQHLYSTHAQPRLRGEMRMVAQVDDLGLHRPEELGLVRGSRGIWQYPTDPAEHAELAQRARLLGINPRLFGINLDVDSDRSYRPLSAPARRRQVNYPIQAAAYEVQARASLVVASLRRVSGLSQSEPDRLLTGEIGFIQGTSIIIDSLANVEGTSAEKHVPPAKPIVIGQRNRGPHSRKFWMR